MFKMTLILIVSLLNLVGTSQPTPCNAGEKLQEITTLIREQVHLEDSKLGITAEEHDLYYAVLRKLLELPAEELERGAISFLSKNFKRDFSKGIPRELPVYAHMHFNLKEYHGVPVSLIGHTQRIIPIDVDPPVAGLTKLYEIWLYTPDSQNNPTVVIAPGLPQEFKTGDEIQDHLKVTGVLFKKYIYKAQDQARFAPLILAGELSYDPPTYKTLLEQPLTLIIAGIFLLLFLVVVIAVFVNMKRENTPEIANLGLPERLEEF